ncbi:hypothetical protein VNO77_24178 [Canavalia gladiata]|uniref:Uncharacterized protein n=1 Tax=Canavalia gladiata TaxID=3824 RepID=A0AAN9L959_CANGL
MLITLGVFILVKNTICYFEGEVPINQMQPNRKLGPFVPSRGFMEAILSPTRIGKKALKDSQHHSSKSEDSVIQPKLGRMSITNGPQDIFLYNKPSLDNTLPNIRISSPAINLWVTATNPIVFCSNNFSLERASG